MLRFVSAFLLERTKLKKKSLLTIFHAPHDVNTTEGKSKSNGRNTRMQTTNRPNLGAEQKPPTRKVGVEYNALKVNGSGQEEPETFTLRGGTHALRYFSLNQNTGQPRLTLQPFSLLPFSQFLFFLFLVF
jgi:hypothetical protein